MAKTAYATTTYFELVARNYAGYGDYSAVASAVPTAGSAAEAPGAPQSPDANANSDMSVDFSANHSKPVQ